MTSFIHSGGPEMASYRYRGSLVAPYLNATMNDPEADTLIFIKPGADELSLAARAIAEGRRVIADFCDHHFLRFEHYRDFLGLADAVTCPTLEMQRIIKGYGIAAWVIPDPYEMPEQEPHCNGDQVLWFGHATNLYSLKRILPQLQGVNLRVVSNAPGCIPWSPATMRAELARADMVILPETASYKSPNRAMESIRSGCFVIADPHPSITGWPVWTYGIREGIEWAKRNDANQQIRKAQDYIREFYSPKTVASAWKTMLKASALMSAAVGSAGRAGSTSTMQAET